MPNAYNPPNKIRKTSELSNVSDINIRKNLLKNVRYFMKCPSYLIYSVKWVFRCWELFFSINGIPADTLEGILAMTKFYKRLD